MPRARPRYCRPMSAQKGSAAPHLRLVSAQIGHRPGQPLLPPLDFELWPGEWLVVAGPNGAGKSTFVQSLVGALPLLGGRREILTPGLRFGYVPQRLSFDPIWPLSTLDVVRMGIAPWLPPFGRSASASARARELLDQVGLGGLGDTPFRSLSGGQRQRALIARALVAGPQVLVLDEPANHLDPPGERALVELVSELRERTGAAVVWISHRLGALAQRLDRIAFLRAGAIRVGSLQALSAEGILEGFFEPGKEAFR